jgi:TatD DNase family protein
MIVDAHCHLADAVFAGDLAAVVGRAEDAGVTTALCIVSADEPEEVGRAVLVRAAWPAVRFADGVHPHRAAAGGSAAEAAAAARRVAAAIQAVAVGEIGLDYHYDFSPRAIQRDVFAAQVELAGSLDLPIVIHTREAIDDTLAVLRRASPPVRGVMHCFTGTVQEARSALDLGLYISLAGIVTFPKAELLREVARFVPEDRLLVETDAPFLAPVPYRGRRNEPAWVVETARVLAETRGVARDGLVAAIQRNFAALTGRRM